MEDGSRTPDMPGDCDRCGREPDANNPLRRIVYLDEHGRDTERVRWVCYGCVERYVKEAKIARLLD